MAINKYSLTSRNIGPSNFVRSWVLEGTNTIAGLDIAGINGATWTPIDTRTADATLNAPAQTYTLTPNGSTTTSFRYIRYRSTGTDSQGTGNNYLTMGEVEFYGVLAAYTIQPAPAPTPALPTLSGFAVSTDGTKLNYTITGSPLTAIAGNLILSNGTTRVLTFSTATQASISGNPINTANTGSYVTIASSTPALNAAITHVSVVNNSTVVPPVTGRYQLAYNTFSPNVTVDARNIITLPNVDKAMAVSTAIPVTDFTEIQVAGKGSASLLGCVIELSKTSGLTTSYNGAGTGYFPVGALALQYQIPTFFGNEVTVGSNTGRHYVGTSPADSLVLSMLKRGDDIVLRSTSDGITFTELSTSIGVLTGATSIYLKVFKNSINDSQGNPLPSTNMSTIEVVYV